MTWIKTAVAEAEATGELAEACARIRQKNGPVSNISEAASSNPRVMLTPAGLRSGLFRGF